MKKLQRRMLVWSGVFALACWGVPMVAQAMFVPPEPTPLKRLLGSAEAYLKAHPNDAKGQYTLGRIHYLAFHMKYDHVPAFEGERKDGFPAPSPQWMVRWMQMRKSGGAEIPQPLAADDIVNHASQAAAEFRKALVQEPNNGLFRIGLACLLEEFAAYRDDVLTDHGKKKVALPADLQGIDLEMIRATYARALEDSMARDSLMKTQPVVEDLRSITSYEAATAIIRLAKGQESALSGQEKNDLKRAETAARYFEKLPPAGMVTPIVFALQPAAHLADLLAPETVVDFDLRGYGWREQWPWVKPALGILVWDPLKTGHVTSARQLFGGYTFQIFRETGYDALAALDDNGDGQLSGHELDGISVWFDRNGNGKSDPGEVIPLSQFGVQAISVTSTAQDGIHPMNPRGLTMSDGRILPTWDWIAEPVKVETELTKLTGL